MPDGLRSGKESSMNLGVVSAIRTGARGALPGVGSGRTQGGSMRGYFRNLVAMCAALVAGSAIAQTYPNKPITVVVPFAAGSGTDSITRILGQQLSLALNQGVVIENKPGASGVIAATYVARAAADGYTLLMATNSTHSANPSLFKNLPYDPVKDFTPVARAGSYVFMLVINPEIPA